MPEGVKASQIRQNEVQIEAINNRAEARIGQLQPIAKREADALKASAQEARAEFAAHKKAFDALQKFFGNANNFKIEGTNTYYLNVRRLQEFLERPSNIRMMRNANVPARLINELKLVAYGMPEGSLPESVMNSYDVDPTAFMGGGRAHVTGGGLPMFGSHFNIPHRGRLAGERQFSIEPSPYWAPTWGYVANKLGFDVGDLLTEPDVSNTISSPPPPTGSTK